MRAERLLRVMFLLQAHGRSTARELAERLGVSTRTIQRDLDALSLAGVPVYAERGRGGGWVLAPDFRTRLDGLTPTEAMAVFLGTTGHVLADLGLADDAGSAYTKLRAALPAHARPGAGQARERVLVDHTGWQGAGPASDSLAVLQQALWRDQWVTFRYGERERRIAPLGLVAKGRYWYVVGARPDGAVRTFRVDRLAAAAGTGQGFARPAGFDLADYWQQSQQRFFAGLRDYPVRLRVRTTVLHRLYWAPNAAITQVVEGPDGWSEVTAMFEKAYETRVFLLGLAGDVVVLAPADLREAMIAAARALLDQHE